MTTAGLDQPSFSASDRPFARYWMHDSRSAASRARDGVPDPVRHHLPLISSNVADLRSIADGHAAPEVADHLVVYRAGEVLLWTHDAGSGDVLLSRTLPAAVVQSFRAALGASLS